MLSGIAAECPLSNAPVSARRRKMQNSRFLASSWTDYENIPLILTSVGYESLEEIHNPS